MVAVAYAIYLGLLYGLQDSMIFPGAGQPSPTWKERAGVELWELEIEDGTVEAIYAPLPSASAKSPAPLLVFAHGNGAFADQYVDRIPKYHRLGLNVLIPEYRGYGRSDGEPSERAIVADVVRFVERATQRAEVDADAVVYHGQSLGGGVVVSAARERPPEALVLESTFTSIREFAHDQGAPGFLVAHPFDSEEFLSTWSGPILLMHATGDPVVPYAMGARLAKVAQNARFETFEGPVHTLPPLTEGERYWSTIREFLVAHDVLTTRPERPLR